VARPGPRLHLAEGRIVGCELAIRHIVAVDQQLIETQIRDHREAVVGCEHHIVRVRLLLPLGVHARAEMLLKVRSRPSMPSAPTAGQPHCRPCSWPPGRVCRSCPPSDGTGPRRPMPRYSTREVSRVPVDRERTDRTTLRALIIADFVCGEQEMLRGIHRQERRADGLRRQFKRSQLARGRTKAANINSLAALVGVSPEVDQVFARGLGRGGRQMADRASSKTDR
jgi:hypothetical protein